MRRWLLVLLGVACLATPASAQVTIGSRAFALASLTGCATANSVLQGGTTVTCTATPQVTSLTFASNTVLQSDAADTLSLRRGTNKQTQYWYGTTDASGTPTNYERLEVGYGLGAGNRFYLNTAAAGTGSVRNLGLAIGGTEYVVLTSTNWGPLADGGSSLGGSANRWAAIWAGTSGLNTTGPIQPNTAGGAALGAAAKGFSQIYMDYTNTATVGPVTINKAAMRVLVAAAGKSILVTDSLVTAASHVICSNASATPTTPTVVSAVPAAGSFTLTVMQMPSVFAYDCFVVNAD